VVDIYAQTIATHNRKDHVCLFVLRFDQNQTAQHCRLGIDVLLRGELSHPNVSKRIKQIFFAQKL
jgi:hypothetical protein